MQENAGEYLVRRVKGVGRHYQIQDHRRSVLYNVREKKFSIGKKMLITDPTGNELGYIRRGFSLILPRYRITLNGAEAKVITVTRKFSLQVGYTISGSLGGDYAQGETVEITAVPDKGYVFSRWVSDGGSFEDANEATTVFTMPNSNVVVEAVFEEYEHECVFTNYYSDNNATCMEDGTKTAECDYCRATDTILDEGSMLDHHYVNGCCVRCGQMEGVQLTPMYRLYNPNSGEHHFTGSIVERDNLTNLGWQYEGIGWYAPINGGAPVYRTFNPNSGDHHYTMSWDEVENLMEAGWAYEGVAWNSAGPDMTPQYRMYNPNADLGSHHYTSSVEERDTLIGYGWRWEGIGWFGYDQPA